MGGGPGPDVLDFAEEDVAAGGTDALELLQELGGTFGVLVGFVGEFAQVAVVAVEDLGGVGAEAGGGALVVAAVVGAAEGVDEFLPIGVGDALRGAIAGGDQFAGGGHGDVGGDPGAQ
ncbi:hypothetical protein NONI108955_38600 [Nocardia ninae]